MLNTKDCDISLKEYCKQKRWRGADWTERYFMKSNKCAVLFAGSSPSNSRIKKGSSKSKKLRKLKSEISKKQ